MEQSAKVKENHQKSERLPLPKSSLTRIEGIYIDLAGAMDNQENASKCEHFSIRGYAAEMRKKDISVCLPFSTNKKQNKTEEKNCNILPPIEVVKYKFWSCHNCLREMGSACCGQEIGKLSDSLPSRLLSKSLCSTKENLNNAPILESAPACTESNRDEMLIPYPGNDMEKRDNAGKSIADGSENDANHQRLPVPDDIISSKPALFPERDADDSDVIGKKIRGNLDIHEPSFKDHISTKFIPLNSNRSSSIDIGRIRTSSSPKDALERSISGKMDLCGPSYTGQISPNITLLECNRSSYKDIGRTETSNPPQYHHRMETGNCEIEKRNVTKERINISRFLDGFSSESSNGIARNDDRDKFIEGSSKSILERAPKVRLLTEILGSSGNVENDQSKTSDSDFESASDFCDDMAAKRKRKINQFENGKLPCPLPKKSQLSKGKNTNFAKRKCMVIDSETEESSGTFTQQKNLKKLVSPSKKKHKQTQQDGLHPVSMPCPENNKKYHFAAIEEGVPRPAHHMYKNTEINPYYTSPKSLLPTEKKSNMIKKKNKPLISPPVPQWRTMLGEGSCVRKDSDSYGRKGVDFSLNSYEATQRNKESHIAKATTEAEPSFPKRDNTVKERYYQLKDGVFHSGESSTYRKNAPNPDSGKGLLYDLNEKIATQSPIRDIQNAIPQFGKGTIQHHRELNMSGNLNSELRNDDQSRGDDDIPMEIVELLAKNQYERRRDEFERNYFSQERNNEKKKFESMGLTKIHVNGLLKSYPVEHLNMRKQIFQTNAVKLSDHSAPVGINETRLNMSKMEGKKSAFVRCNSLSNNQGTRDGRVNYSGYGSIGNGNYQNLQWRNDTTGSSFSPPEARYSIFSNYTNFPQNYTPQASKFAINSREGSSNGKMARGLDLNFANENYRNFGVESLRKSSDLKFGTEKNSNFERQNRDFSVGSHGKSSDLNFMNERYSYFEKNRDAGVDSLRKSSGLNFVNGKFSNFEKNKFFGVDTHQKSPALDPFALKTRGIDLNAKVSGSIDLNSNETIPAMQLLSLMDAGKKSNILSNSDGKRKITSKNPLSSCDYHPKVLDKPLFISDHGPKQLFGRDIGVSSNSSRPSSSKVLDKPIYISDSPSKESSGRGIGLSSNGSKPSFKALDKSMFISDDHSKEPFGRDIGVFSNSSRPSSSTLFGKTQWREKDNFPPPIPAFGPFSSSFPSESNPKEGDGVPTRVPSKSEEKKKKGPAQNSARKLQKKTVYRTGALQNIQNSNSISNNQRGQEDTSNNVDCSVNRNPADFSLPEPGNIYTISGKDLKFKKMMSFKGKQGPGNTNGKRKQKITVPTVPKPQ